jgi:hypothetical protein
MSVLREKMQEIDKLRNKLSGTGISIQDGAGGGGVSCPPRINRTADFKCKLGKKIGEIN